MLPHIGLALGFPTFAVAVKVAGLGYKQLCSRISQRRSKVRPNQQPVFSGRALGLKPDESAKYQ
jgi:hypothetical protein